MHQCKSRRPSPLGDRPARDVCRGGVTESQDVPPCEGVECERQTKPGPFDWKDCRNTHRWPYPLRLNVYRCRNRVLREWIAADAKDRNRHRYLRMLLGGPMTIRDLEARHAREFEVVVSQPPLDKLDAVWQRPRLGKRIGAEHPRCIDNRTQIIDNTERPIPFPFFPSLGHPSNSTHHRRLPCAGSTTRSGAC